MVAAGIYVIDLGTGSTGFGSDPFAPGVDRPNELASARVLTSLPARPFRLCGRASAGFLSSAMVPVWFMADRVTRLALGFNRTVELSQHRASLRMEQLGQRPFPDLPHPLSAVPHALSNVFQSVLVVLSDSKSHAQDQTLSRSQHPKCHLDRLLQLGMRQLELQGQQSILVVLNWGQS